ncbi:Mov34/MPN/PAD-1 family protein [uncultured Parasphingorhabdus sp.]|uniref:Mov34/MPN/PAD-1 family protein n=1 Tax=uncultured Parasphingorhabdus sp. TaxID=2709694 RepID=UPI003747A8B7
MQLFISSAILAELQRLAEAGKPHEICGILFGDDGRVSTYRPAPNVAADPLRHFEIDPALLIAAERDQRDGGDTIAGYYHSHPGGSVRPSAIDAGCAAADGRIWLILNGQKAAAWHAVENGDIYGRFNAITLDCTGAKGQTAAE